MRGVPKVRTITAQVERAENSALSRSEREDALSYLRGVIAFYRGNPARSRLRERLEGVVAGVRRDLYGENE